MTSPAVQGPAGPIALFALTAALYGTGASRGADSPLPTKEAVVQAWKDRTARVKSFDLSWSGTKYALTESLDGPPGAERVESARKPPRDKTFPVKMRFALDDCGRVQFDYEGKVWSSKTGTFIEDAATDIYDGKVRKVYFPSGRIGFPSFHISSATTAKVARDVRNLAVRLVYRPFDPQVGSFQPAELELADTQGVVNGRPCFVLAHPRGTVWVDPAMAFLPVRYYELTQGKQTRSLEIEYAPDKDQGYVPKGWKDVRLTPSGEVMDSVTVTVTAFALNRPIADDTFDVQYPAGTWVSNYITNEQYIQRDHDKRPIFPGEYDGKNYEQLLHSDAPKPLSRGVPGKLLLTSLGIALAILGAVYYRHFRRKQVLPGGSSPPA